MERVPSRSRFSISANIPIVCLDTCAILDMLRDPTRKDVRIHEQKASLELLTEAESRQQLSAIVTDLVLTEFQENVRRVQEESESRIEGLRDQVAKLDELATLHGSPGEADSSHWIDHAARCRRAAERWLEASTVVSRSEQIELAALRRSTQARAPAGKGKDALQDCIILETYLDFVRGLRQDGLTARAVFVSSNTKDYAESESTALRTDIEGEFRSLGMEYAPNMGAAKFLLSL